MAISVRGLALGLDEPTERLLERAAKRLRINPADIRTWAVVRRSLDARRREGVRFIYSLELALKGSARREKQLVQRLRRHDVNLLEPEELPELTPGHEPLPNRPVVVGFGPAGMFAGLLLAEQGYRPLILERGADVTTRHRDVLRDFYRQGQFHPESNLLFGEGGAGTYSDGKLYTRVHDARVRQVLEVLYQHGAKPEVLIDGRPHIGSDHLPHICRHIREHIIARGGEVRFNARLDDVVIDDGALRAIVVGEERIPCEAMILSVGLAARDTVRMLLNRGVAIEGRPFQVGVRIEHPQHLVDQWQYGPSCGHERLPPAEYSLIAKGAAESGDVFSFCMCPGGSILPTNETAGHISTNGASRSARNGPRANSGLVLTLDPRALLGEGILKTNIAPFTSDNDPRSSETTDPLLGMAFLSQLETAAFAMTGQSYRVPVQRASDFLAGRQSDGTLSTSYPLGGQWVQLRDLLPPIIADSIARALEQLDRRLPGFAGPDALITAPETHASTTVRLTRDPATRQSTNTTGLYPTGEGAGYAGGIVSAAVDGLKTAEAIIRQFKKL